jgi:thymidylate synthase
MKNYHNLIRKTLTQGNIRTDRTNTGTISLFGEQLEFDLSKGFPLDTSRQVFMRGNLEELFWMMRGSTDNTELTDRNVNIWSAWAVRQQDLEYTQQERLVLLRDGCVNYFNTTVEGKAEVVRFGFENAEAAGREKYYQLVNEAIDIDKMLADNGIPKLRPNPHNVKLGALGPVYGEQWVNWPDQANDVEIVFTTEQRIQLAEDMLAAGMAEKFTQAGLDDVKEDYAGYLEDKDSSNFASTDFHIRLTKFGVPASTTKHATINQIAKLIDDLKTRPNSRRHIVSAWNVPYLPDESKSPHQNVMDGKMALAPCHTLFQYYVEDRSVQDMIPELPEAVQRDFKWFKKEHRLHHLGQAVLTADALPGTAYWEAMFNFEDRQKMMGFFKQHGVKTQKLSCKLYQRSH